MKNKNSLAEVPFQKIKDEQIEFQILDMQKLLKVTTIYEHLEFPHRLKFNSIIVITKGEGSHNIDFETYDYMRGTVLFIAKNQVTSFNLNQNMNCYMIEFTDDFFNRLLKSSIYDIFDYMRYSALLQLDDKSLESILINIQLLTYQLEIDVDQFKESIVQSLFQSLLLQLKRKRIEQTISLKSKDEKVYYEFIQYVRSNHKYTMRVEDYARQLDISSKTLTRILNKYTNKSTKIYLDEYLLLEIKRGKIILKIEIYYDKECPFCNSYANFLKIKEKHELILFNAIECKNQIENFNLLGFDINNGFIVKTDNLNIYQGVDAIVILNDLSQNKFYFPDNYFFRNIVYPIVKYLRKFILLISVKKVNI